VPKKKLHSERRQDRTGQDKDNNKDENKDEDKDEDEHEDKDKDKDNDKDKEKTLKIKTRQYKTRQDHVAPEYSSHKNTATALTEQSQRLSLGLGLG
jgi:hypothetical protein